jgi:hypothetical protein
MTEYEAFLATLEKSLIYLVEHGETGEALKTTAVDLAKAWRAGMEHFNFGDRLKDSHIYPQSSIRPQSGEILGKRYEGTQRNEGSVGSDCCATGTCHRCN